MTIPASDVAAAAPGLAVSAPRARGRLRQQLSLYVPAGLLILIIAACFLYPLAGNVPPPVGGSVLDAGLPKDADIALAGHPSNQRDFRLSVEVFQDFLAGQGDRVFESHGHS